MPDDQQLSGSDGGSGGSVSDAERMGEESEVGHKMVSLLILSIWIYIFSGDFSILFYFVFFQKNTMSILLRVAAANGTLKMVYLFI